MSGSISAVEAVNFLIAIHAKDPATNQKVLLYSDSAVVVKGMSASAFMTGFSVDIEITQMDSTTVEFNTHIFTLRANSQPLGKKFKTEYELPAIIDDIEVKENASYSLTLVPKNRLHVSGNECRYNHNAGSDFALYPSANFDLQYLQGSLAFYHAQAIKYLFETDYRLFHQVFHFNISSKQNVFAFPCEANSVIWDKRFGNAFDPTRNNCYTLYGTGLNTTDPFILIHGAVLRSYGYAPAFLTEGFANYFSLAIYKMKQIKKAGKLAPIKKLLNTKTYYATDPVVADLTASTFVRYLIDQYTIDLFKKLYTSADDLNLSSQIELTFSKSITELENEWLKYVDTLTIPPKLFGEFADRAQQMLNFPLALEYRRESYEYSDNRADSIRNLGLLSDAYFLTGDYFNAASAQEKISKMDSNNTKHLLALAGYRMMNGDYERALKDLNEFQESGPNDFVLKFNLALLSLIKGDTAKAGDLWNQIVHAPQTAELQAEARIMGGLVMRKSKNIADKQDAQNNFTIAIALFNQRLQSEPALPNPYLWTGIALVGLDDPDNAYDQLKQALFLENRPFYIGMINLWLGKAADLREKRDLAREHYSAVIGGAAAAYHVEEAMKYLDNGYLQ